MWWLSVGQLDGCDTQRPDVRLREAGRELKDRVTLVSHAQFSMYMYIAVCIINPLPTIETAHRSRNHVLKYNALY